MSNVVPFPTSRRVMAKAIPREEFEQLAELALDVVQRIVAILADQDGEATDRTDEHGSKADNLRVVRSQAKHCSRELEQ
jgi:hypothetical protein